MARALILLLAAASVTPALSFLPSAPQPPQLGLRSAPQSASGGRMASAPSVLRVACGCQPAPSRREVLAPAIAWLAAQGLAKPALAFDFTTVKEEGFSYDVPTVWKESSSSPESGKVFSDPILGATVQSIKVSSTPAAVSSIKELGKLERIKISKQLGVSPDLDRADMISAASRKGRDGSTFYDYDLAIAPKTCSRDQEIVSGSCAYDKIILLSACVKGGSVVVLQVSASASQWKASGPALRSLRNSFAASS